MVKYKLTSKAMTKCCLKANAARCLQGLVGVNNLLLVALTTQQLFLG